MLNLLDGRCKLKVQYSRDWYLWIKYPSSHVYYVQFKLENGKKLTLSTRETDVAKAHQFAFNYWNEHFDSVYSVEKKKKKSDNRHMGLVHRKTKREADYFHTVLKEFYDVNTEYGQQVVANKYAKLENRPKSWEENIAKCEYLANYFKDVKQFTELEQIDIIKFRNFMINDTVPKGRSKGKNYSKKSVVNTTSALSTIYDYLIRFESLKMINPCKDLKDAVSTITDRDVRIPLDTDLIKDKLTLPVDNDYLSVAIIGLTTGLRNSEIASIKIENLKSEGERNFLEVRPQGGGKTVNAARYIPLPKLTAEIIKKGLPSESDLWLPNGKKIDSAFFDKSFEELCKFLGIDYKTEKEKASEIGGLFSFYSLRHTFDTFIQSKSFNPKWEDYIMAHSNDSNDVSKSYGMNHFDEKTNRQMHDELVALLDFFMAPEWKSIKQQNTEPDFYSEKFNKLNKLLTRSRIVFYRKADTLIIRENPSEGWHYSSPFETKIDDNVSEVIKEFEGGYAKLRTELDFMENDFIKNKVDIPDVVYSLFRVKLAKLEALCKLI